MGKSFNCQDVGYHANMASPVSVQPDYVKATESAKGSLPARKKSLFI